MYLTLIFLPTHGYPVDHPNAFRQVARSKGCGAELLCNIRARVLLAVRAIHVGLDQ